MFNFGQFWHMQHDPKYILANRFAKGELTAAEYNAAIATLGKLYAHAPSGGSRESFQKRHSKTIVGFSVLLGLLACALVVVKFLIIPNVEARKATDVVMTKSLNVAGMDYTLFQLVILWSPAKQQLLTGGAIYDLKIASVASGSELAKWHAIKSLNDTYLVTAKDIGNIANIYEFTVDSKTMEVIPANALAKELFDLPNRHFASAK